MKGIGKEVDGLYYLSSQKLHGEEKNNEMIMMTHNNENLNNTLLWHNMLGHPSARVLQQFCLTSTSNDICKKCSICPLAKQTRLSFPLSFSKTSSIFDMIHLDVWGPYHVATHNGYKFFLTIVDDKSRMTWVYLMKLITVFLCSC